MEPTCEHIPSLILCTWTWFWKSCLWSHSQWWQDLFFASAEIQSNGGTQNWGGNGSLRYVFGKSYLGMIVLICLPSIRDGWFSLDYLADSVDAFLTTEAASDTNTNSVIPLGLTFSFPVEQTALDSGKILTWTKGFSARNAIGNDVVRLLQDAFDRKQINVKCVALVNDASHTSFVTRLSELIQSRP